MAHLKDLKLRIRSVKSTQKITKAMKMVSAAKLKRARDLVETNRPYTAKLNEITKVAVQNSDTAKSMELVISSKEVKNHLFIVLSSDRGLCGALNSSLVRMIKKTVHDLTEKGEVVKLLCIGKKAFSQLSLVKNFDVSMYDQQIYMKKMSIEPVYVLARHLIRRYVGGEFDVCHVFYNRFNSAVSYTNSSKRLIPLFVSDELAQDTEEVLYDFEPSTTKMLPDLVDDNIVANLYATILENLASEHGARMTAMENATTNAGDLIKNLTIQYNRKRQAAITKELIEIISGAEAV